MKEWNEEQCKALKKKCIHCIKRHLKKWTDIEFINRETKNNKVVTLPNYPQVEHTHGKI